MNKCICDICYIQKTKVRSEIMNEQDRALLKKLQENPNKYTVVVDNDNISVDEVNPYDKETQEILRDNFDGESFYFSTWGENFIVELLQELGFKAEYC